MFWSTVLRLIWVPISFFLSGIVALIVLFTLGYERLISDVPQARAGGGDVVESVSGYLVQLEFLASLASVLTLVPAVLVIIIGEVARIRSAVYYVLAGGAALAVVPILPQLTGGLDVTLPKTTLLQVLATSGFAGGLVYWGLAGRKA